jgi:K+-sensing histidine kinase KdpD
VRQAATADTDATDVVEVAGHFRVYLGAAAGVGKTYAMLSEGQRRQRRGADVVVGFVECHGRPLTEELIGSLEVIPRKVVDYRGSRLQEMDLDAILRSRREDSRAIAGFARKHQMTQIVIGASQRSGWQHLTGGGSNVLRVIREAGAFGIDVHVIARRGPPLAEPPGASAEKHRAT